MGSRRNIPGDNLNGQIPSKPGEGESGEFEDAAVTTRKRRWLFRLFSVIAIPLLIIALAEIGLRLGSFGYSTSFFHRQSIDQQEYWFDNPQYGQWFFPPAMARTPNPFAFPVIKPPQTSRIFVLG